MKKLILLLVTAIALGSVDGYSATPRRSGTRKSTTTVSSKKSSTASPIAGLEKALASTTPRDATSLATLEKNLAWAENIRVKYAEPLTAPQKLPNGKYRYSGNMESLMYEIKKYTSVNESLQEHIGKQSRYNSNRMANAEGSQIMLDYSEFLTLQHINHILGMLPDESKTPFKEAMVKMYLAKGAFLELVDASQWGASPSFAIATYYPAITEGMNEMLFKIWDIMKNDVSAGYNTADQTLQALCYSFRSSDDNRVSTDEFVGLKSKFETAGSDFINAYKAWLEKYPGHNATLANADAIQAVGHRHRRRHLQLRSRRRCQRKPILQQLGLLSGAILSRWRFGTGYCQCNVARYDRKSGKARRHNSNKTLHNKRWSRERR